MMRGTRQWTGRDHQKALGESDRRERLELVGFDKSRDRVVFARVYLTHFERDYGPMNAVYQSYFAPDRLPARTCVGVTGLARGALVEIDLLACRGN